MKRKCLSMTIIAAAMLTLSSCGNWWATTSVGPDLYLDDYYGPSYIGSYNTAYYPGYVNPTPPPPPPPAKPQTPQKPKPSPGNNQPGNKPQPSQKPQTPQKPQASSNNPGSPSQGGFRGQSSGATSRH